MKEENIIQYLIFPSNQKSACLEVFICKYFLKRFAITTHKTNLKISKSENLHTYYKKTFEKVATKTFNH